MGPAKLDISAMESVLTLIVDPAQAGLDDSMVSTVRRAFADLGADTGPATWLAPGIACDIPFGLLALDQADAAARMALGTAPVDVVAVASEGRRKQLLIADMDSTIVIGETLDELAANLGAEMKQLIAGITARAMNGEIDFKEALRLRVSYLKGLPETALQATYDQVTLTPGARVLVQTMKAHGARAILVSGGFSFFTERVGRTCGFDRDLSNRFEIEGGLLTGKVIEPILDRDTKYDTLVANAAEHKLPLAATCAVGDGANDLDMIKAAGLGVAYHAKPIVAAEARVRIDHGDLTALLYAQGYRRDEFVDA